MSFEPVLQKYLAGYSQSVLARVHGLMAQDRLGEYLAGRYGEAHEVRSDRALHRAANALKDRFMRTAAPLGKVVYDSRLQVLSGALGTHTAVSRVQGHRLKASREIRVATVFRDAPAEFLKMILVHELAHLKVRDHDKAFYRLCTHMAPDYHQLEFDLRLYLAFLECGQAGGGPKVSKEAGAGPDVAGAAPGTGGLPHAL